MTNHCLPRSLRVALCFAGCTLLLLTGCARGDLGEPARPSASAEPDGTKRAAKTKAEASSPSPTPSTSASSPTPSPPASASASAGTLSTPKDPHHPAYADVALTTPTSTFTGTIDLATTIAMRKIPSTPGAVGTATVYVAAFRDGIVTGDPSLMQSFALPGCTGCAAITDSIKTQPPWSGEVQLAATVWVLGAVEEVEGRTLVTVGVESISTEPNTVGDGETITEAMLHVWDIQLENTPGGWAVRSVATRPWT